MATQIDTYRVKDTMTSVVISVEPDDTIHEALSLMAECRVTVLPVTDSQQFSFWKNSLILWAFGAIACP